MGFNTYKLGPTLSENEIAELDPLELVCIQFTNKADGYSYDIIGVLRDLVTAPIWDVNDDDFVTSIRIVNQV